MPLLSINKLSELTGKTRESIGKKLDGVPHNLGNGDKRPAKMYDSKVALEVLYLGHRADGGDEIEGRMPTPAEASRDLNIAKKAEIDLKMEVLRKERIPVEDVTVVNEQVFANVAAIIKAHTGKELTPDLVNDIFTEMREVGRKIKDMAEV
jgi:hypothetical protein